MVLVDSLRAKLDAIALGDSRDPSLSTRVVRALSAPIVIHRARRFVAFANGEAPLVVAVGGASLGGSGKTPVAIACSLFLANLGVPCALVGHAYRGRVSRAHIVDGAPPVPDRDESADGDCGDEARIAAAALHGSLARVIVGPTRAEAMRFASRLAPVAVVDGPLDTFPRRATLSLLALADHDVGWVACALMRRADAVVRTGPAHAVLSIVSAEQRDASLSADALVGKRVGLVTAIARPDRALASLRPVRPMVHLRLGNHGELSRKQEAIAAELSDRHDLDLWLATEKGPLFRRSTFAGRPLLFLHDAVRLPTGVQTRLEDLGALVRRRTSALRCYRRDIENNGPVWLES